MWNTINLKPFHDALIEQNHQLARIANALHNKPDIARNMCASCLKEFKSGETMNFAHTNCLQKERRNES